MALPVVQGTPTTVTYSGVPTVHGVTLPAGIVAGEYILVFAQLDRERPIPTPPAGFSNLYYDRNDPGLACWYKLAVGTEGGTTVNFTFAPDPFGLGLNATWSVLRVSGLESFGTDTPATSTATSGSSTSPNSGSASAAWQPADILAVTQYSGFETTHQATASPTGYGTPIPNGSGVHGAIAYRTAPSAGAEDPAAWTVSTSITWLARTVIFKGAGAAGFNIVADAATFTWTGIAAGMQPGYQVNADTATFTWNGKDAALTAIRDLDAELATYALTVFDADIIGGKRLGADTADYVLTALDAGIIAIRHMGADVAAFSWDANDATLAQSYLDLVADVADFTFTAWDAATIADLVILSDPAAYTLTVWNAELVRGRWLDADHAAYVWGGSDAALSKAQRRINMFPQTF